MVPGSRWFRTTVFTRCFRTGKELDGMRENLQETPAGWIIPDCAINYPKHRKTITLPGT